MIAKSPNKNADIAPTEREGIIEVGIVRLLHSSRRAPNIAGMESIKENSTALSLLIPKRSAVVIVNPERDMPGIIAMDCPMPIINATNGVICSFSPFCFLVK